MAYKSTHTGQQIDAGVSAALNPDTTPTENSNALVTSGGVKSALDGKQGTLTFDNAPTAGSNNPVTSDGIKSALNTFVRPNLLDNPYFVGGGSQQGNEAFPINQRGQTIYQSNEYTIDRWIDNWAKVEVLANAVRITTTDAYQSFLQRISKSTLIVGAKYTFSILSYDGTLWSWTFTANTDNTQWLGLLGNGMYAEIQHYQANDYWSANIVQHTDASSVTLSLVAVKLELGSDQTLAHQENGVWVLNEIPNYQQELAKCQRYQQVIKANTTVLLGRVQTDTSKMFLSFPLTVTPRADGTTVNQAAFFVYGAGKSGTALINAGASITVSNQSATKSNVSLYVTGAVENELYTVIPSSDIILDFNL